MNGKIDWNDLTFKTRMKRYEVVRYKDGKFKKWKPKMDLKMLESE